MCIMLLVLSSFPLIKTSALGNSTSGIIPTTSNFTTDSTSNTFRRFLAIGNFYDVTNQAYFQNSAASLNFQQLNPDWQVQSAFLKLYKYANAYNTNVPVDLYLAGNKISSINVDNGDLDYDLLSFDVTPQVKSNQSVNFNFDLKVNNAAFQEGIAVCSGNIFDSICPANYRPILEVTYIVNQVGSLNFLGFSKQQQLNIATNEAYASCQEAIGCDFSVNLSYQDRDKNAIVDLDLYKDNQLTRKLNYTDYDQQQSLKFLGLQDGKYSLQLVIHDGNYLYNDILTNFDIDVTRPELPIILAHSNFATSQGAWFNLAIDQNYLIQICQDADCNNSLNSQNYNQSELTVPTTTGMLDRKVYYYQLQTVEASGNLSLPVIVGLEYRLHAAYFKQVFADTDKISPKNKDGFKDLLKLTTIASEEVISSKLEVSGSKGVVVVLNNLGQLNGKTAENTYLPDGKYSLSLKAKDKFGEDFALPKPLLFIIDNTAPVLK
jgi:hypothetical protein